MIIDELAELAYPRSKGRSIAVVCVGLGYTAVCLDDGSCGLAYTFREEAAAGCSVFRQAGTFQGRAAGEMLEWARHFNAVEAALGVATLNAVLKPPAGTLGADVLEEMDLRPDDVVAMVGYFGPLVNAIRQRTSKLSILERRAFVAEDMLPDWAAPAVLPEASVVVLSATSLLNRTLDGLLRYSSGAREVVILGPTTPWAPAVFARQGVTLLSGVRVVDPEGLLRVVGEGGGTRSFGRRTKKLTLRIGG